MEEIWKIGFVGKVVDISGVDTIESFESIWDCISPIGSGIGSTFTNSPFGTFIALEVQRIIKEEHYLENAEKIGAYFTEKLRGLEQYGNIDNVSGLALIQSLEVIKSKETKEPAPEMAK